MSTLDSPCGSSMPRWKEILLWIALLPGSLLGAMVAFWLMSIIWWLNSSFIGNDPWWFHILGAITTNGVQGAALVYCAAYIAPRGKTPVAVSFAGIVLLISGVVVLQTIGQKEWFDLLGTVSFIVGTIAVAVTVAQEADKQNV